MDLLSACCRIAKTWRLDLGVQKSTFNLSPPKMDYGTQARFPQYFATFKTVHDKASADLF